MVEHLNRLDGTPVGISAAYHVHFLGNGARCVMPTTDLHRWHLLPRISVDVVALAACAGLRRLRLNRAGYNDILLC